jgi:hypothetical protein
MLFAITLLLAVTVAVGVITMICMYVMTMRDIKAVIHNAGNTAIDKKSNQPQSRLSSHQKAMKKWRHENQYTPKE